MRQRLSKLVDVLSALETLNYPYVLLKQPSSPHRILVEGPSDAAVLGELSSALGPEVIKEIESDSAQHRAAVETLSSDCSDEGVVIEVTPGSSKSAASLLWWMALQEGSKAAQRLVRAEQGIGGDGALDSAP